MASKYIKKFKIPNNFENILSDFTKEILRNQPKDIIQFGIEYFKGQETNTKLDYPDKGENRPENYKRPENRGPNIISAENQLEMSQGDQDRLKRSMEKIDNINREPVPSGEREVEGQNEDENIQNYDEDSSKMRKEMQVSRHITRYELEDHSSQVQQTVTQKGTTVIKTETHTVIKTTKKIIRNGEVVQDEVIETKEDKKFINRGENIHDRLPDEERKNPKGRYEEEEELEPQQNDKQNYDEWFTKHSIDKKPIDYKEEEQPKDENLKRTEVGYNTWFKNHSVRSVDQSQNGGEGEGEGKGEEQNNEELKDKGGEKAPKGKEKGKGDKGYDEWFLKHSIDKSAVDYKKEEEEQPLDENLKRTEVGYNTWFKNHSVRSVDQSQNAEEGEKIEYSDWFAKHSGDRMVIDYKQEKTEMEDIPRNEGDYATWFENHSKLTNKANK